MTFDLNNNVNQMILLFVVAVACLFGINLFQRKLGRYSMVSAIVVIVVACVLGYLIMNNNNQNNSENFFDPNESASPIFENFQNNDEEANELAANQELANEVVANNGANEVANEVVANNAANEVANEVEANEVAGVNNSPSGVMNSSDLLPSDSSFNKVNPNTPGALNTGSLLNAGFHIGVDTQGCSLRNANRGLRSEPPNPQVQVSPWLQTTICPDLLRKPLESCE